MTLTGGAVPEFAGRSVGLVAGAVGVILTALSGRYGYHRDELYFLVAGQHLDWGYIDQPPLTPLLARVSTEVFGNTLMGLRVIPTLATMATVLVVALIAREFGGERGPQTLAAVFAGLSGFVLGVGHMASTATYDLLAWMLICLFATRLLRTGDGRWWIAIGLTTGVALQNKYLVVLPLAALLIAVLITGPRQVLRSRWLAAGVAIAAIVAAPNLAWQLANDWPQLTVAGGISEDDGAENRIMFVPLQLLQLSPFLVPVWVAGFVRIWRSPALSWARPVALAYPVLAVIVLAVGGKSYYALPLLLVPLAAGAQPVLDWVARRETSRRVILAAGLVLVALTSGVSTLPLLPAAGINPVNAINKEQGEQVGWPELAATVAMAWNQLPAEDRARATIFAGNYGQAGAIARFGPDHGLPQPYSGHMSFADWPPPPDSRTGPVLLIETERSPRLESFFRSCTQVAEIDNGQGVDNEEQGTAVVRCDSPTEPWSTLWPNLRRYY